MTIRSGTGRLAAPERGGDCPWRRGARRVVLRQLVMETNRNGQGGSMERRPSHHEPGRHPGYSATVAASDIRSSNGASIGTAAGSGSNRRRARARPSPSPCRPREAWFWSAGPRSSRRAGAQCRRRARHFLACGRKKKLGARGNPRHQRVDVSLNSLNDYLFPRPFLERISRLPPPQVPPSSRC
jgi:hypothetical protein